jgi:hypothetical protein
MRKKGGFFALENFVRQPRQARIGAQMRQHRTHASLSAGDGAVDALGRQQQRAFDAMALAGGLARLAQRHEIRPANKLVRRGG